MIKNKTTHSGISVTFVTSMACNLACTYCYETCKKSSIYFDKEFWSTTGITENDTYNYIDSKDAGLLSIETAKTFIDSLVTRDIREYCNDSLLDIAKEGIILDFIGGDSLQCPELVEKILTYFIDRIWKDDIFWYQKDGWRNNWRVSISSNGVSLLNPKAREFCEKWKDMISLGISVDGCPELHDLNRITFKQVGGKDNGSSKYIFNTPVYSISNPNLIFNSIYEWYQYYFPEQATQSKFTLAPNSYSYLLKSYEWMYTKGYRYFSSNRVMENNQIDSLQQREEAETAIKGIYNFIKEHRDEVWALPFDYNFQCQQRGSLREILEDDPLFAHCGAAGQLVITEDGSTYTCFRMIPGHTNYDTHSFSMGTADDPWKNMDLVNKLRVKTAQANYNLLEECKYCPILKSCPSCIVGEILETKPESIDTLTINKQYSACWWHKLTVSYAMRYWRTEYEERKQHYIDDGQDYDIWWDEEYEKSILTISEPGTLSKEPNKVK